jgi:hypothetical protein
MAAMRPPPLLLEQVLRNDSLERVAQHRPNLRLLARRKLVDEPVDGVNRRRRMQCPKNQIPCLSRLDGNMRRFQVPHLANQHDIRVLA